MVFSSWGELIRWKPERWNIPIQLQPVSGPSMIVISSLLYYTFLDPFSPSYSATGLYGLQAQTFILGNLTLIITPFLVRCYSACLFSITTREGNNKRHSGGLPRIPYRILSVSMRTGAKPEVTSCAQWLVHTQQISVQWVKIFMNY